MKIKLYAMSIPLSGTNVLAVAAFSAALLVAMLLVAVSSAGDWRQFRGPDGQGRAEAGAVPLRWSETEHVAWKTNIPGKGWSSPVIDGDQIWMTTATTVEASEAEKKRLAKNTGNRPLSLASQVSMRAICVDRRSGKVTHDVLLMTAKNPQPVHTLNSYASPTPTVDAGRIYCHFGSSGTACLDTTSGNVLWTNQDLVVNHENGPGCSPFLWKDKLIIHYDGSDKQFVAALDTKSGSVAWKTERSGKLHDSPQLKKAYGSPIVVDADGRDLLLSQGANWLYGYDPENGDERWKVSYGELGFSIVPKPVVGQGMVFATTCFPKSKLLAIRYEGLEKGETPSIVWRFVRQAPRLASSLLVGDEIYCVSDRGVASCVDAKTGTIHWQKRIGGNYAASPVLADGRIHFFSREGVTTIVAPGKSYRVLATNTIDGTFMASPAVVDGAFYFRTETSLYRVEASPK